MDEFGDFPAFATSLLFVIPICLGYFLFYGVVCWLVASCYKAIPQKHRKMESAAVWLTMIPVFNLVWNFFVFPKLADSYRSFFDEHVPDVDPGTCGRELAFAYAITAVASIPLGFIMCLGCITTITWIVLLILVLVKAVQLKQKVQEITGPNPG